MQAGYRLHDRKRRRLGFGASNMDFIPSNIFQFDQALDHDGELLRISRVPCVEHKIRENHAHPLPHPLNPPPNQKEDPHNYDRFMSFSQPKRKASITFGEIDADQNPKESKKVKKIMHREIERQRRQEMATLYANLRSHLPLEYLKGKRSISDHVHQAANYIKHIQKNIEEQQKKRDELKKQHNISGSSTAVVENSQCSSLMEDSVILVRPACIGVEVAVNTPLKQGLPLSRVIDILVAEGLSIVSCNSAKRNQRLLYTLESEVSDGGGIDIPELQNRLIKKCTSEPGFK
ncbi:transcription factor bHLH120 [Rosa chinensis]|uniref:transcription factor bHLH120 n=1 Tax=Rosa chinensis TaxID=74649 RepID=UPI000D08DD10|nr:transcription factor bHLH120 [Rosa chinensis]XP_040368154.1 transcription factor bHLH120 [Rosa chinensis]